MDPPEDRTPSPDPPDDRPLQPWQSSSPSSRVTLDPPTAQDASASAPDVPPPQPWRPLPLSATGQQCAAAYAEYAASAYGFSLATSSTFGGEDEEAEEAEESGLGQDVRGGRP